MPGVPSTARGRCGGVGRPMVLGPTDHRHGPRVPLSSRFPPAARSPEHERHRSHQQPQDPPQRLHGPRRPSCCNRAAAKGAARLRVGHRPLPPGDGIATQPASPGRRSSERGQTRRPTFSQQAHSPRAQAHSTQVQGHFPTSTFPHRHIATPNPIGKRPGTPRVASAFWRWSGPPGRQVRGQTCGVTGPSRSGSPSTSCAWCSEVGIPGRNPTRTSSPQ